MSMEFKQKKIGEILSDDYSLSTKLKSLAYKDRISTDVIDGMSVYETVENAKQICCDLSGGIDGVSSRVSNLETSSQNWNASYGRVQSLTANLPRNTIAYKTSISASDIEGIGEYTLTSDFKSKVSSEFTDFSYVPNQHLMKVTIADKTLSVDMHDLVKDKIVKKVEVKKDDTLSATFLEITFELTDKTTELVSIRINDLFPVSKQGHGIKIDSNLCISLDTSVFGDLSNVNLSELSTEQKLNLKELSHRDLSDISSNFGKAYIKNIGTDLTGQLYDLSVEKIGIDDYNEKVVASSLFDNTLYVVSSDYIEAYGQQICNLAMGEDFNSTSSFIGIAATDKYVQSKVSENKDYVDNKLTSIKLDERISSFFGLTTDEIKLENVVDVLKFILSSFGVK